MAVVPDQLCAVVDGLCVPVDSVPHPKTVDNPYYGWPLWILSP